MFQNHLSSIKDVGLLPSIAFLMFFIFFIAMSISVIRADKKKMKEISSIPLDDQD